MTPTARLILAAALTGPVLIPLLFVLIESAILLVSDIRTLRDFDS
jgi:hypothetical protein